MEKTEILSLHSLLEKYFGDIEMSDADFIVKRLMLNAKLDQHIQSIVSDFDFVGERKRERERENAFSTKISIVLFYLDI